MNTTHIFTYLSCYKVYYNHTHDMLTLCSHCSPFGSYTRSQDWTFGTDTGTMQNELNPIVLHFWTQWHCLELSVIICWIPIVSNTYELPALSQLLIFQLGYLEVLKNNLAFTEFSTKRARVNKVFKGFLLLLGMGWNPNVYLLFAKIFQRLFLT